MQKSQNFLPNSPSSAVSVLSNQSLISQLVIIGQDSTALAVCQILIFIILFYMKCLMQQPRCIQDSTWLHMQYQASFTSLYIMTMHIVRSWIVHLTPILCLPKSSQAFTLCVVSGFLLVKVCALVHHLEVCPLVDLLTVGALIMRRSKNNYLCEVTQE